MKVAVRYLTKTGHTKLLADAVAETAGVKAETVDTPLTEDVDILFLGSAVYAANLDAAVKGFIDSINVNVGKIVPFSSAAILKGTYKQVKACAESKGIKVSDEEFFCKGAFGVIAKGRPNQKDAEDIKAFAKKFISE